MLLSTRSLRSLRAPVRRLLSSAAALESEGATTNMYNPTEEHGALRQMVRQFAEQEVDPQRAEYNEKEQFNRALFARCGELGLLGVTADESCGGSGMDAVAACVVSEELSAADPAFALSYLAHAMLYVNNVNVNASEAQKRRWLPGACDGSRVCAMVTSGVPRPRRLSRDFGREKDTIMHLRETLAGKRTKTRERRAS
jgi:isovaleryl-CoA dehydrogenase